MENDRLKWFREAKYGMFIHWGLYAIPGGVWEGQKIPFGTEWIMKNAKIPLSEYKKLAEKFNPDRFDPYYYVRNAKKWGMKYLCVTSKHHDGFAMFDSAVSDYTVMKTPYGRDIIKEFADAAHAEDLPFCVYYSQMQDWEDPDGNGNTWDFDPKEKHFEKYFYGKVVPQVTELLTNYGKIHMIWFDTPYDMPIGLCRELAELVHRLQPDCLINGRIGYRLGDYRQAADNAIPLLSSSEPWEVPMTLNSSWGYSSFDFDFKSPETVISTLARINGKGGNLLLNVGPDQHGEIPEQSAEVLENVGKWLDRFGESIFGTTNIPNFPYLLPFGEVTYSKERQTLYLHVTHYPGFPGRILLTGLETKVLSVRFLPTGEDLKYSQSYEPARDEHRLYVFLPENAPAPCEAIVAVRLDGAARAQKI